MLRKREFVTCRRWTDAGSRLTLCLGASLVGCSSAQLNGYSESSLLGGSGRGSLAGFLELGLSSRPAPNPSPALNWHQSKSDLALAAWGKQAHGEQGGYCKDNWQKGRSDFELINSSEGKQPPLPLPIFASSTPQQQGVRLKGAPVESSFKASPGLSHSGSSWFSSTLRISGLSSFVFILLITAFSPLPSPPPQMPLLLNPIKTSCQPKRTMLELIDIIIVVVAIAVVLLLSLRWG